jgi:hypothetical protein
MKSYEGLNASDWKIVQIALNKMEIRGKEAPIITGIMAKVQMELELLELPVSERPKKGDIITKE